MPLDRTSNCYPCLQEKREKREARKIATVQEYLEKVKSSLSDEGFLKFKECMVAYKKVSILGQYTRSVY